MYELAMWLSYWAEHLYRPADVKQLVLGRDNDIARACCSRQLVLDRQSGCAMRGNVLMICRKLLWSRGTFQLYLVHREDGIHEEVG